MSFYSGMGSLTMCGVGMPSVKASVHGRMEVSMRRTTFSGFFGQNRSYQWEGGLGPDAPRGRAMEPAVSENCRLWLETESTAVEGRPRPRLTG
jgi:hypothetical protein